MKHSKVLKATILLGVLMISNIISMEIKKLEEAQEQKCADPCQECQRVVYHMKFQGTTDCEVGACRNTCYKIRQVWGSAFNPFEPFLKDVFGKCEICFRNGYCTISNCKEQEQNELNIIDRIVDSSHLTARLSPDLIVSIPVSVDPKALPHIVKVNQKVQKVLVKQIKYAIKIGNAEHVIPKVQNLVKTYFDHPTASITGNASTVLNGVPAPVLSSAISYSDTQVEKDLQQVDKAQKVVQKIGQQVNEIEKLKNNHTTSESQSLNQVTKNEKKEIKKLIKKVNKVDKKLINQSNNIQKLLTNPTAQDSNTKEALAKSLDQVKLYQSAVKDAKTQLKEDKKRLVGDKRENVQKNEGVLKNEQVHKSPKVDNAHISEKKHQSPKVDKAKKSEQVHKSPKVDKVQKSEKKHQSPKVVKVDEVHQSPKADKAKESEKKNEKLHKNKKVPENTL